MLMTDEFRLRTQSAISQWRQHKPSLMAFDTETTGLEHHDRPFCVTVAWDGPSGLASHYLEITDESRSLIREMLDGTPTLIAHNAKFDLGMCMRAGVMGERDPHTVHDTETLAHLADPYQKLSLKGLARDVLGMTTNEDEVLKAERRKLKLKKADGYHRLPREVIIPYAIKDAEFTLALFHHFFPEVTRFEDLTELYELEQQLCFTFLEIEDYGMAVDTNYLSQTAREYGMKAERILRDIRARVGNDDFKPNSPQQVMAAFVAQGISLPNTEAETLAALDNPLAKFIVKLRGIMKIHGTYLLGLLTLQRDGIVHPWFRANGTRTGRSSSGSATE